MDVYDKRILNSVQERADLTHAELAERVHLSPSQCARRLQRLREEGYIERTVAILNRERLGLDVLAHVLISLQAHEGARNDAFRCFVDEAPEVLECYMQSGDADLLMKVAVPGLDALAGFIDRLIAVSGGLATLRSYIVLRPIKTGNRYSIG
ncbi:Lrp/AsnC family transcriptional regulator [Aurantiacibacter suaedae]|uniref:Lrp/AsnC family transcriptional regulator n=1 Tax=Aurantiacibacter suaedae TaxID=2545755 RepID=UPI0019D6AA2B|nr:Lrp/AsnC family transcriptional regulator [Aurantiacibacter suaedae]